MNEEIVDALNFLMHVAAKAQKMEYWAAIGYLERKEVEFQESFCLENQDDLWNRYCGNIL